MIGRKCLKDAPCRGERNLRIDVWGRNSYEKSRCPVTGAVHAAGCLALAEMTQADYLEAKTVDMSTKPGYLITTNLEVDDTNGVIMAILAGIVWTAGMFHFSGDGAHTLGEITPNFACPKKFTNGSPASIRVSRRKKSKRRAAGFGHEYSKESSLKKK